MYLAIARQPSLYDGLRQIDEELAARTRGEGCPRCGGPLHWATYERKPRGFDLPDGHHRRLGLCCGRCRRRTLPPSTLFLGRHVYLGAVLLIAVTVWQGRVEGASAGKLRERFGVTHNTLRRWRSYFSRTVPASARWKRLRGHVTASVRDDDLPTGLLVALGAAGDALEAVRHALLLFATG